MDQVAAVRPEGLAAALEAAGGDDEVGPVVHAELVALRLDEIGRPEGLPDLSCDVGALALAVFVDAALQEVVAGDGLAGVGRRDHDHLGDLVARVVVPPAPDEDDGGDREDEDREEDEAASDGVVRGGGRGRTDRRGLRCGHGASSGGSGWCGGRPRGT